MREIRNLKGGSFLRIGKTQSDTIGVELKEFPGVLFICKVPNCENPLRILKETVGKLWVNIELDDALSFGPGSKNPEKSNRWLETVTVTRGFVGEEEKVLKCEGEKLILERNGLMLIVSAESPNILEVDDFLKVTKAIHS